MADGLVQSDLDDPLKFLQLAATGQPKIRFNLGLGAFRCATLLITEQLRRAEQNGHEIALVYTSAS